MKKIELTILLSCIIGAFSCSGEDESIIPGPDAEYWQVTWDLNGGSWPSKDNHADQVLKGGKLKEPNKPVKSGSTFEGWYKESALTHKITFPYDVSNVTADFTLYARWKESGAEEGDYKIFTSVSDLKSWLANQKDNTADKAYKAGLKGINLDQAEGWAKLGVAISENKKKYIDLDLQSCTGGAIPDGSQVMTWEGPNQVHTIKGAFVDCDNLVAIRLPANLSAIGNYAFYECDNLQSVRIANGLVSIGEKTFYSCTSLKEISLPVGLKTIGDSAFSLCRSLTQVTLPDGVVSIDGAFSSCGLVSIRIPASLTSVGDYTFFGTSLQSITLPEGFQTIGYNAFAKCDKLVSVNFPETLVSIANSAFESCKSLVSVKIPSSVTQIGVSSFSTCLALQSVTLSENLVDIPNYAFYECTSLESITIPRKVKTIGASAFAYSKKLSLVVVESETPPSLHDPGIFLTGEVFSGTATSLSIKVPANSVNTYKQSPGWKTYASQIVGNTN